VNKLSLAAHKATQLRGPKLLLARLAWALVALTVILAFTAALPYRIEELRQDPYGLGLPLGQWGFNVDAFVAYGLVWELLMILASLVMAAVIFWRKSDEWMGLLISTCLVLMLAIPPVIPTLGLAFPALKVPIILLRLLAVNSLILVCFLFPDGRFVPHWALPWFIVFIIGSPYLIVQHNVGFVSAPVDIQSPGDALMILWLLLGLSSGVLAQVYRFRRVSSPLQRQQTKWVMYGFTAVGLGMIALSLPVLLLSEIQRSAEVRLGYLLITIPLTLLAYFAVPLSLGVSILRYRLWDIDLIVRRTLVYSALTATLATVYFAIVVFLQQMFLRLTGERSPAAIVISTLAIATLSSPLRRRIQIEIDRQFFRSKYDAGKALANFSAVAREEVELELLTARLISVIEDAVQPEHIAIWLRDPGKSPFIDGN
jgi:hypothetical protein